VLEASQERTTCLPSLHIIQYTAYTAYSIPPAATDHTIMYYQATVTATLIVVNNQLETKISTRSKHTIMIMW